MKSILMIPAVLVSFFLASCGSSSAPTTYSISGTISGLSGTGLVLQDNGRDNLLVSAGTTSFLFATSLTASSAYAVTVLTEPSSPAQTCVVSFGSGTVSVAVTNVQIVCANNTFTIGGAVSGLSGTGLVLQDNGGSNLPLSANGTFTFPTAIPRGSSYNVTVLAQPSSPAQTCGVANGYGTNLNGNATDIQVTCVTTTVTYTVGGTVAGLAGAGLVLQDNSGNNLPVSASGSFTFTTAIASGTNYSVTVLTQPSAPAQNCVVAGGGGTATANITGIQVNCTTITYSIGGTISGLTGAGLELQDNGGNSLSVGSSASTFTFTAQVASGLTYAVTVLDQPVGQSCSITNGSGTVTSASITNVAISCSSNAANLAVTVSGMLPNTSVVLQNNGGDDLSVSTTGVTTNFNTPVASGSPYAVTVMTQPAGATCTVGTTGSGTLTSANINVAVTCGTIIAAGESHTCALTSAGAVLCWGLNEYGQLGNGNAVNSTTPVQVVGLPSGVVSIAAGYESTCALTNAGAVWCWGHNATGQLGNGTLTESSIPVQVLDTSGNGPLGGVAVIASGQSHTCAATSAGAAFCWGDNSKGELGNGTEVGSNLPVAVSGLSSGVATIAAGSDFTCAVTTSKGALCWGEGGSGQLGDGYSLDTTTPAMVMDSTGNAPLHGVVTISAGLQDACALTSGETLLCWGTNNADELGDRTTSSQTNIPEQVLNSTGNGPLTGVVAMAVGQSHTCVAAGEGSALCWGDNTDGELGNGSNSGAATPVAVTGLASAIAAVAVAAGSQHSCAVTGAGAVQCWGSNLDGQLDDSNTANSSSPVLALAMGDIGSLQLF
ncbi:MAG TPA: hypothetical protein VGP19_03305 [Candidatus Acidoferrales bacterium]|jgi:alpha-tubulin suppressor-like RCC1 family protein|nr:hypothetical protein [Candidatus Acidoferrales bacterium]